MRTHSQFAKHALASTTRPVALQFAKKTGDLPFLSKTDLRVSHCAIRFLGAHKVMAAMWRTALQVIALTYQLEREANGATDAPPCTA